MFRPPAVFKLMLGCMMAYKDSRRQLLQSSSESWYTSLAIPSLQSDTSLNSTKPKAMRRIESEGWANQLASHDVIGLSLILYSSPVSGTFLKRIKRFSVGQNSINFWEAFSKFRPKSVWKSSCHKHFKWLELNFFGPQLFKRWVTQSSG